MNNQQGWRLGSLAGAQIILRPGALVIIAFFMLASLPIMQNGTLGPGQVVAGALGISLLILLSVFLHEVAHLLVGKIFGAQAKEIVLTLMGGHATFEQGFRKPWHGAVVAVAGPTVNLVLALFFHLGSRALPPGLPTSVATILTTMNLALALFNLIPGLPLDGGAALRDVLWSVTGSRAKATNVAATTGQVLAVAGLISAFAIPMYQRQLPNYTLLLFVTLAVVFLWQGAAQAKKAQKTTTWLENLDLAEFLRPAVALNAEQTVAELDNILVSYPGRQVVINDAKSMPAAYPVPQAVHRVPAELRATTPVAAVSAALIPGAVVDADISMFDLFKLAGHFGASVPFFVVVSGTQLLGIVDAQKTSRDPN